MMILQLPVDKVKKADVDLIREDKILTDTIQTANITVSDCAEFGLDKIEIRQTSLIDTKNSVTKLNVFFNYLGIEIGSQSIKSKTAVDNFSEPVKCTKKVTEKFEVIKFLKLFYFLITLHQKKSIIWSL